MNKSVIVFGIIIASIVFWFINSINELNDDIDVRHGYKETKVIEIETFSLDFNEMPFSEQKELWNVSQLKKELIYVFPNFIEMKTFINDEMQEESSFKSKLLTHIESIEDQYIAGTVTAHQAKLKLEQF